MQKRFSRALGVVGTVAFIVVFVRTPSFPTPDKILVFLTLVAMIFGQAIKLLKRFVPLVVLLLVYESFRGLVPMLNAHVNFTPMIVADRWMGFGTLQTTTLQNWLWRGHVQWFDFVFYGAYTLHFVLPFALAVLIWKTREKHYWHFIVSLVLLSFAGFLTYLAFPAAPPWMASERGYIEPITRVSSQVWAAFGIHDFPSVYNKISPNPVAAVPSLHAAYSFLFAFFITLLYKTRWKYIAWIYPFLIWVGTVYMGEHYLIDAILGGIYAVASYFAAPYVVRWLTSLYKDGKRYLRRLKFA
jgi:membrane-associated phospholipid phosphatase